MQYCQAISYDNNLYVFGGASKNVYRLSDDGSSWNVVLGLDIQDPSSIREYAPALVISKDLLHC